MDWKWFVVGAMAAVAVFFVVKYCMLRRNIKEFAAQMEECLDQVIVGDTVEPEKMQDTLFAKLQEKLYRVEHIFALRGEKESAGKRNFTGANFGYIPSKPYPDCKPEYLSGYVKRRGLQQ